MWVVGDVEEETHVYECLLEAEICLKYGRELLHEGFPVLFLFRVQVAYLGTVEQQDVETALFKDGHVTFDDAETDPENLLVLLLHELFVE